MNQIFHTLLNLLFRASSTINILISVSSGTYVSFSVGFPSQVYGMLPNDSSNQAYESRSFPSSPNFGFIKLFSIYQFDECEIVSHFSLHFPGY